MALRIGRNAQGPAGSIGEKDGVAAAFAREKKGGEEGVGREVETREKGLREGGDDG